MVHAKMCHLLKSNKSEAAYFPNWSTVEITKRFCNSIKTHTHTVPGLPRISIYTLLNAANTLLTLSEQPTATDKFRIKVS